MKVDLVYVHPALNLGKYEPLAQRFVASYMAHPPGATEHTLHVVVNGNIPGPRHRKLFEPLPVNFMSHSNVGQDIGAYQFAAATIESDLMVFIGANCHFRRAGWLDRIVNVFLEHGPGLYAPWGFHQPNTHLRTTCFWCPPPLLNSYPYFVADAQRYMFEHGHGNSITAHVNNMGYPVMMVTWNGAYPIKDWHHVENEQCLMLDQFCDSVGYQ